MIKKTSLIQDFLYQKFKIQNYQYTKHKKKLNDNKKFGWKFELDFFIPRAFTIAHFKKKL